jgi:hypothetical protein
MRDIMKDAFQCGRRECVGGIKSWDVCGRGARKGIKACSGLWQVYAPASIWIKRVRFVDALVKTKQHLSARQISRLNNQVGVERRRYRTIVRRHQRDAQMPERETPTEQDLP